MTTPVRAGRTEGQGVDLATRFRRWRLDRRRARLGARRSGSRRSTLVLLAALAVLFAMVVGSFAYLNAAAPGAELSLDQLARLVAQRRVGEVEFLDEDARIVGTLAPPAPGTSGAPRADPFWVAYPRNDVTTAELISELTAAGARVRVDPQPAKATVRVVLTVLLPLMILANLFALFLTSGRGGGSPMGEVLSFGQMRRGKMGRAAAGPVTFEDVAGLEEAVVELREVVDYLKRPERYAELSATAPKGVLLFGPPGCGKTLLARAVAGEAEVPFFSVAGAEFVESLVGVGAARVRDLFSRVRAVAPAIVFIDELDAAGRRRSTGGGGSEERDQTLNQLLVEMDGFDAATGIVVMAATNRADILDPALLRPGRFDRHITIDRPDLERREAILRLHASRRPVAPDVDFALLARRTPGFSGADLANVVNEAALLTIRAGRPTVTSAALSEAVQRVLAGPQRRGHLLTDEERRRLACHEAGHAVVAAATGQGEVHRVSILARGRGLGAVGLEHDDDVVVTRSRLQGRLVTALAGLAAEELVFGEPSTGAEDDLATATALARDMAGRYGMTETMGRMRLLGPEADVDLAGPETVGLLAGETHAAFDLEVRRLLDDAFEEATRVLERHRPHLHALIERLLADEALEGPELQALLPHAPRNQDGSGGEGREAPPQRSRRPRLGQSGTPRPGR